MRNFDWRRAGREALRKILIVSYAEASLGVLSLTLALLRGLA